ncbi:MAG: exopolysaccharide biosynthesis polyprenyl glycosylphosphotransferase [Alphaproteobacteria bacterium]|nr:exopolysaccharide biosynthesis polyprenyl glycosylphosphotransferase [Alphaproteobacteria bacterium]
MEQNSVDQKQASEAKWVPWLIIACDTAILEFCLYLSWLVRAEFNQWFPIPLDLPVNGGITAGVLVVPLAFHLMGLYPGYGLGDVERIRQQETGIAIVFSSLLIWDYLAQDGAWSRGILLATWLFAAILLPLTYGLLRKVLVGIGKWGVPIIVVGARDAGAAIIILLKNDLRLGLRPVGVLDFDSSLVGNEVGGVPVVGTIATARQLANSVKICAVAMPELNGGQLAELSAKLPFPRIILLPDFGSLQSTWITPRDLGGVLGLEVKKNLLLSHNRVVKRILDIVLSVPLAVLAIPILLILCIAIMVISPGTPFYKQRRGGQGGHDFDMLKLRTMYRDADQRLEKYLQSKPGRHEEWEKSFKLKDDPRVLPILGKFLRQSSLDELPQLFNVLKGDMSLVGPRPFPLYHLEQYSDIFRELRQSVPPGMTGMWQVEIRSDGDIHLQEHHDTYYIRNWSIWLDIYLLARTVTAVISGRGAH